MRDVDIRDEMRKQGVECEASIDIDGRIHRFDIPGDKRGRKNGWYVFHQDGDKVYGAFGDWKSGIRGTLGGTKARRVMAQVLRDSRADEEVKHERAALRAQMEWDAAPAFRNPNHPYLERKRVPAYGLRVYGEALLVPMQRDGAIVGLQKIYPDGQKRFTPGCRKLGASFLIGAHGPVTVVAEGYATAASIHMATSLPVLVAFDCGNLMRAAIEYGRKRQTTRWIWAADNDARTPGNPGLSKATIASKDLGGSVAVPSIVGDFNDLHQSHGIEAVMDAIYAAL